METQTMVQVVVSERHTIRRDAVTRDPETGRATKQVKIRYKPGQTLEVEESEAKRLINSGYAVNPAAAPRAGMVDAKHSGIVRMGQQLTRGADATSTLVAGGTAGQSCGQPSPALNTVNPEQENEHVSN